MDLGQGTSRANAAVVNQLERLGDKAFAVDLPGHGMNRADPCPHFSGLFL
jgi:hypothetical protein